MSLLERSLAVVCSLVALGSIFDSAAAQAQAGFPEPIELDARAGISYGAGYDTRRKSFLKQCVEFDAGAPKVLSGQPLSEAKFELVTSNSDIVQKMQLSADASFSALIGGGKLSLSSKNKLVADTTTNRYNLSLLAYSYAYAKPEFLAVDKIVLKPEYKKLLDDGKKAEFKAACGDTFVFGVRRGREFYGTVSVANQDLKTWTKFSTENNVNFKNATYEANLDVNFEKSLDNTFKSTSLKINARSNVEGLKNPTTLDELVTTYNGFNQVPGGQGDIKLHLISYRSLNDVEVEDPLDLDKIEVQQSYLVDSLWDLKAMQDDVEFILQHRDMFALGSTKAVQDKRFNHVRDLQKRWKDEFWSLQEQTKKCMEDFTPACAQLADKYQVRITDLGAERALLPERYSSDCYGEQWLNGSDAMDRFFTMGAIPMGSHNLGDSEMGGGPVRAQSVLRLIPDGMQLKGRYEVTLSEWKVDKNGKRQEGGAATRFQYASSEQVIQRLDDMTSTLKECTYTGIGVQEPVKDPSGQLVGGFTDAMSGKDPRGVIALTEGAQGMLGSLRCVLDGNGGEDNKLTCEKPDVRNRKLALINTLDLNADRWTDAPLPKQVVDKIKKAKKQKRDAASAKRAKRAVRVKDLPASERETLKKRGKKKKKANAA